MFRNQFAWSALRPHRFSRRVQRKCQRLLRYARHKWPDQPPQADRNVPRQRHHLALHVDSAVPLFHPPPRFHAPQKSPLLARRFLALAVFAPLFHPPHIPPHPPAIPPHLHTPPTPH